MRDLRKELKNYFLFMWVLLLPGMGFSQLNNDFELPSRDLYRAQCWEFAGTTVGTNNPVINGARSGRYSTLNNPTASRYIRTPWMDFSGSVTIDFKFRVTNTSSGSLRFFIIVENKETGAETEIFNEAMNNSVKSRTTTVTLNGVHRISFWMRGNGGSSQGRVDDIFISSGVDVSDKNSYQHPNNATGWGCDCLRNRPVINNETADVDEDDNLVVDVTANDTDADNDLDPPANVIVRDPDFGTAFVEANGDINYTPNPNYFGPDTIVIRVSDMYPYGPAPGFPPYSDLDMLFITVNPVNDVVLCRFF